MDIKEAAALASLFGIEPTEGFQRFVSFWMHGFAWDAIERARIGYRTRDDELWHDVLSRIAPGAAQAAAVWILGITVSGLDKLIATNKAPPHFRAGRLIRWRPSVALAWLAVQEKLTTPST
jgi:predicted DNA-binding transcriptional regulator AlpA